MLLKHGRSSDATLSDVGQSSGTLTPRKMLLDNLLDAPGIRVGAAVFQPGTRTGWHFHTEGQLFLVEHGRGIVVSRDAASIATAGDLIYSPPGEEHWHGADPTSVFIYTVVSLGETKWLDSEVLDHDYLAAFE
jgi:quercetin dioxygenase-like cupin family protein